MESARTLQGSREGSYFMRGETWECTLGGTRARRRKTSKEEIRPRRLPRIILIAGLKFEPSSLSILSLLPTPKKRKVQRA
jgi:hypothetical protein